MAADPRTSETLLEERDRYVRPEPTCQLRLEDLREANEFDEKLLDSEGIRYDGVRLRGAWLVPKDGTAAKRTHGRGLARPSAFFAWLFRSKN